MKASRKSVICWIWVVESGVVQKSGSWFSYGEERLGQGREGVRKMLKEAPELLEKIERHVKTELGILKQDVPAADAPGSDAAVGIADNQKKGNGK